MPTNDHYRLASTAQAIPTTTPPPPAPPVPPVPPVPPHGHHNHNKNHHSHTAITTTTTATPPEHQHHHHHRHQTATSTTTCYHSSELEACKSAPMEGSPHLPFRFAHNKKTLEAMLLKQLIACTQLLQNNALVCFCVCLCVLLARRPAGNVCVLLALRPAGSDCVAVHTRQQKPTGSADCQPTRTQFPQDNASVCFCVCVCLCVLLALRPPGNVCVLLALSPLAQTE
jgi:hypothetical protein